MHKHIKHLILLTIILVGLSSLGLIGCAENHKSYNINITIDGKPVNFTGDLGYPYLTKTQRTMVPIRIISENMGYNVDWSKDTWHQGIRKVWINNNTNRIELEIGKSTAIVNGKSVPIDRDEKTGEPVDTKAELVGSRTYVPLRFITEAMGGKVEYEWKNGNHYIDIITGKDVEKPEKPKEESKVITPVFKIVPHNKAGSNDFIIYLHNFMDYKGTDATFSPELISHPQYNRYRYRNPFNWDEWEIADVVAVHKDKKPNYNSPMFRLYSFGVSGYTYDIETGKPLTPPPEGTKMTVKVTVKVNGEEKAYTVDIIRRGFTESYIVEGKPIN